MTSKALGYLAAILTAFAIGVIVLTFIDEAQNNSKYKYTIGYSHGKWSGTDYTDTFEIQAGPSIKYVDEVGDQVIRYGTFSIQRTK